MNYRKYLIIKIRWRPTRVEYSYDIPLKYNYEDFERTAKEKQGSLVYKFPKVSTSRELLKIMFDKKPFNCDFSTCDTKESIEKFGTSCILEFSGEFESANIDKVIKVSEREYNIYLRADTNTLGCYQWFNFVVRNYKAIRGVQFNIMNMRKPIPLFETVSHF